MPRPPPSGIASRALTARFRTAVSNCIWSMRQRPELRLDPQRELDASPQRAAAGILETRRISASIRAGSGPDRSRRERPAAAASARAAWLAAFCAATRSSAVRRAGSTFAPDTASKKLEIAGNHRQQIVEIVRDPAGQLAHQLHLFGEPQRRLGLAALLDFRLQKAIGLLEFPGSLDHALFELAVEPAQLAFGMPGPQQRPHRRDQLRRIDRLDR